MSTVTVYQLRFRHSDGSVSYEYAFVGASQAKAAICTDRANEWVKRFRELHGGYLRARLPRTATVVEYDNESKSVKRGGEKFKLGLRFLEARYRDGSRTRDEWYEVAE